MKNFILVALAVVGAYSFTSCTKDTDGIVLQAHDNNRMMDSMHAMMSRMESMTMTMDPEIDFTEMMKMHHQGAINMSKALLADGHSDSLKRFAQKVINEQVAEIATLQAIRATLTVDNTDMVYMQEQMDNMKKSEKTADVQLLTGDLDNDYATLMMIHHQGAIDDASGYLHHGNNTQLKAIASNIITAQTKEIIELSDWLKANKR